MLLNNEFWNERWLSNETQWDIGYPAPAIVDFINKIDDKSIRILIPGCGNAYEAEYLHNNGFSNVFVVDYAAEALKRFSERVPSFPKDHLISSDFFHLEAGKFDLVIEQTFFCAIDPSLRKNYVEKMHEILSIGSTSNHKKGVLAGLLLTSVPYEEGPPFPGSEEEYRMLFGKHFTIDKMEPCQRSITPRAGRELWIELTNK